MKRLRKQAKEVLHGAHKVYHYRRDRISGEQLRALDQRVGALNALLADPKTQAAPLEDAVRDLDALLRQIGGKIHPKGFWNDNIEVALVAAIIVIGIRTFFFQPFIIPTNSMYPTYSGMRANVYAGDAAGPSAGAKILNLARVGARHFEAEAPASGEVRIPLFSQAPDSLDARLRGRGFVRFDVVDGRKWFGLLPAKKREYTFFVDDAAVRVRVPLDFSLDEVVLESFFPDAADLRDVIVQHLESGALDLFRSHPVLATGRRVDAGDRVVEFDITLGDALFVDRISYHFRKPRAGEPFVFRTRDIPGIEGGPGQYVDKYYIKRIAGVGGETLAIRDGALYADGEARDEAEAFVRNANASGEYGGYLNRGLLDEGRTLQVPENKYVALGDNSGNSLDSRYWGFVPEKAVIGKAVFIYYPFTGRWGPAD